MRLHARSIVTGCGGNRLVVTAVLHAKEIFDVLAMLDHVGDFLESVERLFRAMEDKVLEHTLNVIVERFTGGAPDVLKLAAQVVEVNILQLAGIARTVRPGRGWLDANSLGLCSLDLGQPSGLLCFLCALPFPVKDHSVEGHPLGLVTGTILIVVKSGVEAVE